MNLIKLGGVSEETIVKVEQLYANSDKMSKIQSNAGETQNDGPLQFMVDMVPSNAFSAMSDNGLMLQVIFFAIFLGIAMLLVDEKIVSPLKNFFRCCQRGSFKDGRSNHVNRSNSGTCIDVFGSSDNKRTRFLALLKYAGVVVLGLSLMVIFYMI